MDFLIDPLLEIDEYNKVLSSINNYSIPVGITGPSDSQKAHIAYALCEHSGNKGIFIAYNEMQARRLYDDFAFFLEDRVLFFPAKEVIMHDVEAKSNDSVFQRTSALERMLEGSYNMLVTSAEAFSQVIVSREYFEKCILEFEPGTIVDLEQISRRLLEMGYDRVVIVENKGQFTVRGGIIDIFSVSCDYPVRIELLVHCVFQSNSDNTLLVIIYYIDTSYITFFQ
jgi:transcription-repair coupling factor (superfamily II helicase)